MKRIPEIEKLNHALQNTRKIFRKPEEKPLKETPP